MEMHYPSLSRWLTAAFVFCLVSNAAAMQIFVKDPSENAVSVTLFLPAPYGNARFYKVFAKAEDEPPPDEGQDP